MKKLRYHRPSCLSEQDIKREEEIRLLHKKEAMVFLWTSIFISAVVIAVMLAIEITLPGDSFRVLMEVANG